MQRIFRITTLLALMVFSATSLSGQGENALGTFTPYSVFGIGDLNKAGTSFNKAMGGIGVGVRDNRLINILNPASLTERDTLSFLMDFGVSQRNILSKTNSANSAYNVFNMHHFVMSFPLYQKSAFAIGVLPYSSVGYNFEVRETDPAIINEMGDIVYNRFGSGGINKAFVGVSMDLLENFSIGAEGQYYFGTIDRRSDVLFNSEASFRNINTGVDYVISSLAAKFGVQYNKNMGNDLSLTAGATWMLGSELSGDYTRYAYANNATGSMDTVYYQTNGNTMMEIPSELAIGFSVRKKDKWLVGADYSRQDWSNAGFAATPGVDFSATTSNSFKLGFEYIPNRFDVRYYSKRITYRGGVYYDQTYMKLNGQQINSMGITFGATLPLMRLYNALGVSVDVGQRGSLKNNLVRERYVMLNLNFSLHDLWFIKYRYD
ncbi:MAG: hypothetical protein PHP33_03245 [Bacteroidales bacterium]|nr:hypothetical protein [Bacteroidales bacterium]